MKLVTSQDLDKIMETVQDGRLVVVATLKQPLAGGQPATDAGLAAFAEYHLGLLPGTPEYDEAIERIKTREIGERDTTPELGEVETQKVYAVNVIRRNEHGPFIGTHQLKALLKQAASRLGLFQSKRGSKGDVIELGTILPFGQSHRADDFAVRLYDSYDGTPAITTFVCIQGSVQTPKGKMSVQHHTETAPAGSEFAFEIRWPRRGTSGLTKNDMLKVVAAMRTIGIGSCLSLEYGRFDAEVQME